MKKESKYQQCKELFCEINDKLDSLLFYDQIKTMPVKKTPIKYSGLRSNALSAMPKKLWLILLLLLLFTSCSKTQNGVEIYTIKQGSHYTYHSHKIVGNNLKFDVLFESSCAYDLGNINQKDINKLFGFNACNSLHHEFSARFGWVYNGEQIEIYAYVYDFGVRDFIQIAVVNLNEWNTFELTNTGTAYAFKVNHILFLYEKDSNCVTKYNYMLYPYFGGDEVAPHDITIQFKSE